MVDLANSFSKELNEVMSSQDISILLADDEPLFGETTASFLRRQNYRVKYVPDGESAAEALETHKFDLVIADLDMPGNRNLELLNQCRRKYPHIPFLIVTGRPTIPSAVAGIKMGVHDYFLKPFELDDLAHSIRRALPIHSKPRMAVADSREILGSGAAVTNLKKWISQISTSNATVLIRGESGTGKELLARAIHNSSPRSSGPYITVDCASIPETLLESTLFGHVKGAFTGAVQDKQGLIETADGGTLFLDEIGELPITMQSKLLRVLQFGTFVPVGSTEERRVDVRILAATHRDLAMDVERGGFRLDLYYRLSVLEVVSPALRERLEDLELLAQFFLDQISQRDRLERFVLSSEAIACLRSQSWPGNIRELQNTMERVVCVASDRVLMASDFEEILNRNSVLGNASGGAANANSPLGDASGGQNFGAVSGIEGASGSSGLSEASSGMSSSGNVSADAKSWADQQSIAERQYLENLLYKHRGNVSQAAREAGITRQGLHKAIGRLGLEAKRFRVR